MRPAGGRDKPATPDDVEVRGLAGERTDLAWSRSALALSVAAAAIVRRILTNLRDPTGPVIVLCLLCAGLVTWCAALWWSRLAARTTMEGRPVATRRNLLSVTVATVLFAVAALILSAIPLSG
jgi:uncharacterized membrane protein YidH (DUF202 family)